VKRKTIQQGRRVALTDDEEAETVVNPAPAPAPAPTPTPTLVPPKSVAEAVGATGATVGANNHAKLMNADALPGSAAAASASTALAMEGEAEKKRPSGRMAIRSKGPPGRSSATKLPPVAVP
jgi:hypothetical protein